MNDVPVDVDVNEHDHYRGLHIVVIDPTDGSVEWATVFDTYESPEGFDGFIAKDLHLKQGSIVAAACKDDCATKLSLRGRQWFANMGSKEIWNLGYRQGFAFIGISGREEVNEKRAIQTEDQVSVGQLFHFNADIGVQGLSQTASDLSTHAKVDNHSFDNAYLA